MNLNLKLKLRRIAFLSHAWRYPELVMPCLKIEVTRCLEMKSHPYCAVYFYVCL